MRKIGRVKHWTVTKDCLTWRPQQNAFEGIAKSLPLLVIITPEMSSRLVESLDDGIFAFRMFGTTKTMECEIDKDIILMKLFINIYFGDIERIKANLSRLRCCSWNANIELCLRTKGWKFQFKKKSSIFWRTCPVEVQSHNKKRYFTNTWSK